MPLSSMCPNCFYLYNRRTANHCLSCFCVLKLSEDEKIKIHYKNNAAAAKLELIRREQADYLESELDPVNALHCKACDHRSLRSLQNHIMQRHNLKLTNYYKLYAATKDDVIPVSVRERLSDAVKGEKNPAFQHGGRLSPFSKKFIKYETEEQAVIGIRNAFEKSGAAQADHGNTKLKYYLDKGMSEAEASAALKDRQQTFTLDKCITRWGRDEGKFKWQARQDKWQNTLNNKSDEEIEAINNSKIWKSGGVSKQSIRLFEQITRNEARWSEQGGEAMIKLQLDGKLRRKMADFKFNFKIIEYFGTYWHADPRKYPDEQILIRKRSGPVTAKSIRADDKQYIEQLESLGYEVLIVWEQDFITNPADTIQRCNQFLDS